MMTILEAIDRRCSRRSYLDQPIDPAAREALQQMIHDFNAREGLTIRLLDGAGPSFQGILNDRGVFDGVNTVIALCGRSALPELHERLGYYGELLALEATRHGLGTCWAGGTFDRGDPVYALPEGEEMACLLTAGYCPPDKSAAEVAFYEWVHIQMKTADEMMDCDRTPPDWFLRGVEAVTKAPSGMHQQPAVVCWQNGEIFIRGAGGADLGIAKAHFDLAAGGRFAFGPDGRFTKN